MFTSQIISQKHQLLDKLDIQSFYKQMQSSNVLMSYKGSVSNDLLTSLLAIAQYKLDGIEQKSVIKKKIFSILVEILQNIYHHFANTLKDKLLEDDSITFLLMKVEDDYMIVTGNYVATSDVYLLRKRIDEVNSLSAEELKEKYREQLNIGSVSPKGGAGLGIIDIARKSSNKLEYEFVEYDADYSFFNLTVKISTS